MLLATACASVHRLHTFLVTESMDTVPGPAGDSREELETSEKCLVFVTMTRDRLQSLCTAAAGISILCGAASARGDDGSSSLSH